VPEDITLAQFKVYLGDFSDAISMVSTQSNIVHETLADIEQELNTVTQIWQSPAASTFDPLRTEFHNSSADLGDVLAGILHRMRITYQNYLDAERKAVQNLTAHREAEVSGSSHGPGSPAPHHGQSGEQPNAALLAARAVLPKIGRG
jgi:uncharacterized protein YukE